MKLTKNDGPDFYHILRNKINEWLKSEKGADYQWTEFLLLVPDMFHLLYKLSTDEAVPMKEKVKVIAAIAYFISPIDLLPEAILGPVGYLDDLALAAWVVNSVINNTHPDIVRRHWAGDGDVLEKIKMILKAANKMIGSTIWGKLKGRF